MLLYEYDGQVRQNPNTLMHIFIDEIPFSSFLDDHGAK